MVASAFAFAFASASVSASETPLIGAIVRAYALAFGVLLVIFSFKLRSRLHGNVSSTVVGTTA